MHQLKANNKSNGLVCPQIWMIAAATARFHIILVCFRLPILNLFAIYISVSCN